MNDVIEAEMLDAEILSVYAVTTRYPGEDEEVSRDEALRAIELAEIVKEAVERELEIDLKREG